MSKKIIEIHYCDFCEKELKERNPKRYEFGKLVTEKNGVCDECFDSFKEKTSLFWKSLHTKNNKDLK